MTKAEAIQEWKDYHLPAIREVECKWGRGSGKPDRFMRRQDWNDFVDMLCKEKRITSRQGMTWATPQIVGG